MGKIRYLLATGILLGTSLFGFAVAHAQTPATLDPKGQACAAIGAATSGSTDCTNASGPDVSNTLKLGINAFSLIVGVAAIIMIIVGGFKYVTSQGEGANTAAAKNTILYAIIGLIVVALAQIIVTFVLARSSSPCGKDQIFDKAANTCIDKTP